MSVLARLEREKVSRVQLNQAALLQSQGCIDFLRASGQLAVSDQRLSASA